MADFVTTAKRGSWASRFTPQIYEMRRQLQDELRDRGPTTLARDIEQRIRMVMGVVAGHDLPERRLHQASFPTRSKRPEMRSLWEAPANKADVSRTTTDDLPAASQGGPYSPV